MKKMKKLFALLLVLCMVFVLCACGGNSDTDTDDVNNNVENEQTNNDDADDVSEEESEDDEEEANTAAFTVTVVDEGGNPVEGVMVQVCKDACIPAKTDANGVATFNIEIENGHKLSIMSKPEGYEYDGEAEIYLEAGATEYTLTLKAVQ